MKRIKSKTEMGRGKLRRDETLVERMAQRKSPAGAGYYGGGRQRVNRARANPDQRLGSPSIHLPQQELLQALGNTVGSNSKTLWNLGRDSGSIEPKPGSRDEIRDTYTCGWTSFHF